MKRHMLVCILAAIALIVQACGSSGNGDGKSVGEYLPASDELTGWTEDTSLGEPGPEETTEESVATGWVNGAIVGFIDTGGWVALALEHYQNADYKTKLSIYEMSDSTAATAAYDFMSTYNASVPWADESYGAGESVGRFGTIGTYYCYANAVKGKYFVETTTEPIGETTEVLAKEFFTAVLNKLP